MNIKIKKIIINYEVMGKGKPLIMLHGNNESLKIFKDVSKALSKNYQVYLIDSRMHGLSSHNVKLSYDLMRDDLINFIKELKIEKPIVYGFSDGGIVALMAAIKEEALFQKLILSGINIYPKMFNKDTLESIEASYKLNPNVYDKLMLEEPNLKIEDLNKLKLEVNLIVGENDCILKEHTLLIKNNLVNSTLDIIKNEDHASYVYDNLKLYNILKKILA